MRPGDRTGVQAVYAARARASTGLLRRNANRWARHRRRKGTRGLWLVAEHRGKVVGYAWGSRDRESDVVNEVVWHPEVGDAVGDALLAGLLRRLRRRDPAMVFHWAMPGSPLIGPLSRALQEQGGEAAVFMAAVVNPGALLADTRRILERRLSAPLRLRIGSRIAVAGDGPPVATVSLEANVLLGLLLGLRPLSAELRWGRVRISPRNPRSLRLVQEAFPSRRFWIQDTW